MDQLVEELERYTTDTSEIEPSKIFDNVVVSLEAFAAILPIDRPIAEIERLESLYKKLISHIAQLNDLELAHLVAITQKKIGFILKYKSYGIKASTPLGFSIFFLEPSEGFSFQRHIDTKTEVFHFIKTKPGKSFAFLCNYPEWKADYRPDTFLEWLDGGNVALFDRFCHKPDPGDILRISAVGLVHSVLGCVMEEYANVSTDMVDRLYDQNMGKLIPQKFNRKYFLDQLTDIQYPKENRLVSRSDGGFISQLLEQSYVNGITVLPISEAETYSAKRISIPPKGSWQFTTDRRFMSAFVSDGSAQCELLAQNGQKDAGRELQLDTHDVFLGLPRCEWRISNFSEHDLWLSVLEIDENFAL